MCEGKISSQNSKARAKELTRAKLAPTDLSFAYSTKNHIRVSPSRCVYMCESSFKMCVRVPMKDYAIMRLLDAIGRVLHVKNQIIILCELRSHP